MDGGEPKSGGRRGLRRGPRRADRRLRRHGAGPQIKALLTTGAHYLMVHAVLALVCAIWPDRTRSVLLAGWLAAVGGLVFCLAMSAIALLSLRVMGAIAPIGGMLMIAAWLVLLIFVLRSRSTSA